jgi:prepilin-type N-terminal cleavage/methylation domain-containing protein/prepilin-type processing-associated H-X9-DG protein
VRSSFSLPIIRPVNIMSFTPARPMDERSRFAGGFTLIELLIIMAVIAILITIAYPTYTGMLERGKATKDMSNLRQIGLATQGFINDNDGVLFSYTASWMSQLNPKYVASWAIFQSPFDKRPSSEAGDSTTPISYGVNVRIYPNNTPISSTRIATPSAFILFAPAQDNATTVNFQGLANSTAPGVSLLGNNSSVASTPPGAAATGGTHNNRQRINALFADLHCQTMLWTEFTNTTTVAAGTPNQWTPYLPYP